MEFKVEIFQALGMKKSGKVMESVTADLEN